MNPASRSDLEARMREEIVSIQSQMVDLEERARTVDLDQPIGRLSRMDSLANQSISINARDKARARLTRLERALVRVAEDDFGCCADCGEPIALARLLALPEATLCVHCAE